MGKHDNLYHFLLSPTDREDLPSLTPDEDTALREFRWRPQSMGSAPLMPVASFATSRSSRSLGTGRIQARTSFGSTSMFERMIFVLSSQTLQKNEWAGQGWAVWFTADVFDG